MTINRNNTHQQRIQNINIKPYLCIYISFYKPIHTQNIVKPKYLFNSFSTSQNTKWQEVDSRKINILDTINFRNSSSRMLRQGAEDFLCFVTDGERKIKTSLEETLIVHGYTDVFPKSCLEYLRKGVLISILTLCWMRLISLRLCTDLTRPSQQS